MGVRQSGRLSEASCGVTDFKEPFLLPPLSSAFQPVEVEISEVALWTVASENTGEKKLKSRRARRETPRNTSAF